MQLSNARSIADDVVRQLLPYCDRIEIAGSIRRLKPEVKDIEIVCVPKRNSVGYLNVIQSWKKIKGEAHGKYTQRALPQGIVLDIFRADDINFGTILLIRTGDADFSKAMMSYKLNYRGFVCREGYIRTKENDKIIPTPEENNVFQLTGIPWMEPEERTLVNLKRLFQPA